MNEQVLVYEIKSSADVNSNALFSPDKKHFYWNDTFFKKLQIGDYVFIVNTHSRFVLFTKLEMVDIPIKDEGGSTSVSDMGQTYTVSGKWDVFIRLKILNNIPLPINWTWKSLGSSEITYLNGPSINKEKSSNRIQNINQLKELSGDDLYQEVLDESLENFIDMPSSTLTNIRHEKIEGLVVCDDTGWIEDAITELKTKPLIALWWDKSPSGGGHVINLLQEAIKASKDHCFYIYYTKNQIAYYRARIIDFTFKDNYNKKNWNKGGQVAWFNSNFSDYSRNTKSGVKKSAKIIFLSDRLEKLAFPVKVDDFRFYGRYAAPTQNNMQPYSSIRNNNQGTPIKNLMSVKETVIHIHQYLNGKGFKYDYEEISNFLLSLKTKPFVILAGISGTGKTQLPRMFAEAIGLKKNIRQVPVRPDWTDGSDLLGYTSLTGEFIPKDLTLAIQEAFNNATEPYFFILDEMNLARVEHYFSDFLSVIETREWASGIGSDIKTDEILRKEILQNATNSNDFHHLGWPKNLYLIGTVNMDETTHAFSRKVLDRANSIEMNDINLDWTEQPSSTINSLAGITNSLLETEYLMSIDLSDADKDSINTDIKFLKEINEKLQIADLQFASRVRDEIAFYLVINKKYKLLNDEIALDFQLVQKVLPRIHGSSERIQRVLIELLNLFEGKNFRVDSVDYSEIEKDINSHNLKFKRSTKKILFMLKRFDEDRFTSFWL